MSTENTLDLIERTRGKVLSDRSPKGRNMFLIWGYPIVFFMLLEFATLQVWQAEWCLWIWIGIPLIGAPLTAWVVHKDHIHSHHTEFHKHTVLEMWIFIGCIIGLLGFAMGFAGIYKQCFYTLLCLLSCTGVFVTGVFAHFRPMIICSIIATGLSTLLPFLQDDIWHWQLLGGAIIFVILLLIPGHIFRIHYEEYGF